MTIRALKVPGDLLPLADMLVQTFQYPENPEWSVQADEEEDISREIRSLKRIWPLLRMTQWVSKPLRDLIRGFVWEESGRIGAVVMAQRRGSSNTWTIGTVGVLPEFRRRGLARQLLTRVVDDIRQRGGTHIVLGVIDKNVPAYSLYRSLGFEHYSSQIEFSLTPQGNCQQHPCPADYSENKLERFDWKKRYELAKRISPSEVTKHEPVEAGRFKNPAVVRLIAPLLDKVQKRIEKRWLLRKAGTIVGHSGCRTTATQKGTSSIWAQLDPERSELAPYIVSNALTAVTAHSPNLRVQFAVHSWMPALSQAAKDLGFTKRLEYHWLGLIL
ncbi:GNAT family N-acetyltransferase [Candidatus Bipolaricaulota bacterium]